MELEALEAIYMEEFERLVRRPRDAYRHAQPRSPLRSRRIPCARSRPSMGRPPSS